LVVWELNLAGIRPQATLATVKVAIDTRRVTDFGIGTYIRNVVRTLGRLDTSNQYLLIGPAERMREIGPQPPNFCLQDYNQPENSLRNYLEFQRIVRRFGADLVHVPHLLAYPEYMPCPYVMTVHDLLEQLYPTPDERGLRGSLRFWLTRRAMRRAQRILAVSNSTKSDIIQLFGMAANKIEVVYNAIDDRFRRGHATDADRQFISVPALCRKREAAQEHHPHHRSIFCAQNRARKRTQIPGSEAHHHRRRTLAAPRPPPHRH
jgi:glycosyltransferase involved in cell wall biosynthesis